MIGSIIESTKEDDSIIFTNSSRTKATNCSNVVNQEPNTLMQFLQETKPFLERQLVLKKERKYPRQQEQKCIHQYINNYGVTKNKWSLNSGATDHMYNNAVGISDVLIKAFNGESWTPGTIRNVLYVPELKYNSEIQN